MVNKLNDLNQFEKLNDEVLYAKDIVTKLDKSDISNFKNQSSINFRKRIRLCAHNDQSDLLHEMLIVHQKGAYVRPHRHHCKSESTHIVEGSVDVVLFFDDGRIEQIISMGDYKSDKIFYYRIAKPIYHTLIVRSDFLVFHETTNGPFDRSTTNFAPWAPVDSDATSISHFMSNLEEQINFFQN
jgi:cupin fold WbuC family metalloprotein